MGSPPPSGHPSTRSWPRIWCPDAARRYCCRDRRDSVRQRGVRRRFPVPDPRDAHADAHADPDANACRGGHADPHPHSHSRRSSGYSAANPASRVGPHGESPAMRSGSGVTSAWARREGRSHHFHGSMGDTPKPCWRRQVLAHGGPTGTRRVRRLCVQDPMVVGFRVRGDGRWRSGSGASYSRQLSGSLVKARRSTNCSTCGHRAVGELIS